MDKLLKSAKTINFWMFFLLIASLAFLALVNFSREYVSEMKILVIPKSEQAVKNSNQIIDNAGEIVHTIGFFDDMLISNPEIEDRSEGLSSYRRKLYWENKIESERLAGSGVLKIQVCDKNSYQSEIMSYQSAVSLASYLGRLYNIRNEIDIRFIEGPMTRSAPKGSLPMIVFESIIIGLAINSIVYFLIIYAKESDFDKTKKNNFSLRNINRQKEASKKKIGSISYFKNETAEIKKMIRKEAKDSIPPKTNFSIDFEKKTVPAGKKSAAPDNLPVADPGLIFKTSEEETAKKEALEKPADEIIREATPEEVKERLNKLLSGKF